MEQQLAQCLHGTLSPDSGTRSQAESALLGLHSHPPCGLALCNLVLSPACDATIRQSAAVSLRKWIRERWSAFFDGYVGFSDAGEQGAGIGSSSSSNSNNSSARPLQADSKTPIRHALLQILALTGREERRLRNTAAACLSLVASSDWPDEFPELLPSVQTMLSPGQNSQSSEEQRDRVHGALVFLSEFWTSEMDERQILGGAKEMLPLIEAVLANESAYSAGLRSRCILIFRQLLSSLYMVRDVYPDAAKQIAQDVVTRWLDALKGFTGIDSLAKHLLAEEVAPEDKQGSLALVNEAWRTLKVAAHFKAQVKPHLNDLFSGAIALLSQLDAPFARFYLTEDVDAESSLGTADSGDADAAATLPNLVCSVIDFVTEAIRGDKVRSLLLQGDRGPSDAMKNLVGSTVSFARVTSEEEEEWSSDANIFVMASDEDGVEYGLRVACADLLQDLLSSYSAPTLSCLDAVSRLASPASDWKGAEATLATLGGVSEEVSDILESSSTGAPLDLEAIFTSVVLPSVQSRSHALLTGRAFIFASQYATTLPDHLKRQFVEAAISVLEAESLGSEEETLIIKLSAVRCLKNFYRRLNDGLLSSYTPRIIAQLGPLLSQATEETLILILVTIQCVVGESSHAGVPGSTASDNGISPQTYEEIVRASLSVWRGHASDYIMTAVISDLLESLASLRNSANALASVGAALPVLGEAISADPAYEGEETLESAIALSEAMLQGMSNETAMASSAVQHLCGPIMQALQGTEDRDILQNGIGCLTLLVRKAPAHVVAWRPASSSSSPTTAVHQFLAILSRLLVLDSESGGLRVGDFVIAILRKMPQEILPVLPDLLNAMVRRLATAKTATFIQSLVLPFAYLMQDQAAVVLDLLESVRVPVEDGSDSSSKSSEVTGLQILAAKWSENVETIQGFWAQRISTVALTRLLQQSGQRSALNEIVVRGDEIPDTSGRIMTRSRAKSMPRRFTEVSLPVKVVKMLLSDYDHATTGPPNAGLRGSEADPAQAGTDDEDDEWDDEDGGGMGGNKRGDMLLSDLLDAGLDGLDNGALEMGEDDEEDLKDDEVYNMDLKSYLEHFFVELSRSPQAGSLAQGLNEREQSKLREIMGRVQG